MKSKGHDAAKAGYHKMEMGGIEKDNIHVDAYASKDESPKRSEKTSVHAIAHHSVTGEMYSGAKGGKKSKK